MLDRDLEHPDITRTLHTGYPQNKRTFNDSEIVDLGDDEYIQILNRRDAEKGNAQCHT